MQDNDLIGAVSPNEAARLLGIGRTLLFELLASGEIRSVRIHRRRLIARVELQRFLASLPAAA